MGDVGCADPASGSTVMAAALTVPSVGTGTWPTLALPFACGLNVTDGTGFPSWMNHS
jgi:hypothetical protein